MTPVDSHHGPCVFVHLSHGLHLFDVALFGRVQSENDSDVFSGVNDGDHLDHRAAPSILAVHFAYQIFRMYDLSKSKLKLPMPAISIVACVPGLPFLPFA